MINIEQRARKNNKIITLNESNVTLRQTVIR